LAAENGNFGVLHKMWEWAEKKLTTEEINKKLMLGTHSEGRTGWQLAAKWGNFEVLHKILKWAKERIREFGIGLKGN